MRVLLNEYTNANQDLGKLHYVKAWKTLTDSHSGETEEDSPMTTGLTLTGKGGKKKGQGALE